MFIDSIVFTSNCLEVAVGRREGGGVVLCRENSANVMSIWHIKAERD